jgi:hypothetical protein
MAICCCVSEAMDTSCHGRRLAKPACRSFVSGYDSFMDEREARVGTNEALFRKVNERIEQLNEPLATVTDTFEVICECDDPGCVTQISMASDAYERVRTDATLFIVAPGHENSEIEDIVETQSVYHLVRKHVGLPARIAEETDPRS